MTAPTKRPTAAPTHLSAESKAIRRSVLRDHELETRHESILSVALEAFDRMREAQAAVTRDGAYVEGRFGTKSHPAPAVERDSRLAFLQAQRELGLDLEAPASSRPPSRWRPQ